MRCPYCSSSDVEEIADDRFYCNDCEEYFDFDEIEDEFDESDEEDDDYFL